MNQGTRRPTWIAVLAGSALLVPVAPTHAALLHSMFQDHAVLQRDRPIAVWGTAQPGETLTVTFADQTMGAQADGKGQWSAALPAMAAGGPYTLSVRSSGGVAQTASDVLVGDVYLCSGQSNMGMQVSRSADSYNDIANSANDSIRMMNVGLAIHATPQHDFRRRCSGSLRHRATVPEFSATCFFFARELQKSVPVPLGLINSSWGGSKIEAWMSDGALRSVPYYPEKLDILKAFNTDPDEGGAQWGALWESWWHSQPETRGIADPWSPRTRDDPSGKWRRRLRSLGKVGRSRARKVHRHAVVSHHASR